MAAIDSAAAPPNGQRQGIALCLSGGGYRAALFHLGGLRRLDELGVLSQVDTITSVSGGSVLAAKIAAHVVEDSQAWGQAGERVAGFESGIAAPMRAQAARDIRTRALRTRFLPWNWLNQNAQVDVLADGLTRDAASARLVDLPERPRFVFCATDFTFRDLWLFDSGARMLGDDTAGRAPLGDWTIARAAAVSACLAGAFRPMRVSRRLAAQLVGGTYRGPDRDKLLRKLDLGDGGFYDDLGVEPVWGDHACLLVSDGGPAYKPDPHIGWIWRNIRYVVTPLEQATRVRKLRLRDQVSRGVLSCACWDIADRATRPGVQAYSEALVRDRISQVRIDLDELCDGEQAVLENHGYLVTDEAVRDATPELVRRNVAAEVPHVNWLDEGRVEQALKNSHKYKVFRRC
jgi:NTE family protein